MQLEDGTYQSERTKAHVHDELRAALGPHALIDTDDETVMVDLVILRLLLNEVSTNAAKYAASQKQISAKARLEHGAHTACSLGARPTTASANAVQDA